MPARTLAGATRPCGEIGECTTTAVFSLIQKGEAHPGQVWKLAPVGLSQPGSMIAQRPSAGRGATCGATLEARRICRNDRTIPQEASPIAITAMSTRLIKAATLNTLG